MLAKLQKKKERKIYTWALFVHVAVRSWFSEGKKHVSMSSNKNTKKNIHKRHIRRIKPSFGPFHAAAVVLLVIVIGSSVCIVLKKDTLVN